MSFVPYATSWPTLSPWQASFGGYVFGADTDLELKEIGGIDMPAVRTGDSGRPREHGLFRGLDVMGGRELTFTGDLHNRAGTFQEAEEELDAATIPGGSEDTPLFQCLPGWGTLACMARIRKRSMPREIQLSLGNLGKVALLWAADDPRWYSQTQQVTVPAPAITGFSWPINWPLSWGGGKYSGQASITNAGNIPTRPILTVEGPSVNPVIINATAPGSPGLAFDLTINAGERLVIDTDMREATLYSSASTPGSTRTGSQAIGSKWFVLEPGTSLLQFVSATGEGQLTVEYASAWII